MNDDWERGYAAGYRAAHRTDVRDLTSDRGETPKKAQKKTPRKPSAYGKRYGSEFRRIAPKYKTKAGGWKKDGFKKAQAAAHKAARRGK